MKERRLLEQHFAHVQRRLLAYAEHTGLLDHPSSKGLAREGVLRLFLERDLPSIVDFRTGEILDPEDRRSGQIDILLQSPSSPRLSLFGDIQIAFSDFVIGAIEIKSTIEREKDLYDALSTFQRVKALRRDHHITARPGWLTQDWLNELEKEPEARRVLKGRRLDVVQRKEGRLVGWKHPNTPCFLIAYRGPPRATLEKRLRSFAKRDGFDTYWPEVVAVLDRDYHISLDDGWIKPPEGYFWWHHDEKDENALVAVFAYLCQLIESWGSHAHYTQFGKYFRKLASDPEDKVE